MPSPPTDRVIDIIELLAHQDTSALRTAEIARRLGITQSTAHTIVNALCDRGWLSRDPVDKTLILGPVLESVAELANTARPHAHAARQAALELSESVGHAASVTERAEMSLVLTYFGGGGAPHATQLSGDRIPFVAPFGSAFAAWETEQGQRSWIERGTLGNSEAADHLLEMLDETRTRGFSVERMTPSLARTAELLRSLDNDPWSTSVREVIDGALVELSTAGLRTDQSDAVRPVSAISAPVFDRHGLAVLNVAVHPFTALTADQTAEIGSHLLGRDHRREPLDNHVIAPHYFVLGESPWFQGLASDMQELVVPVAQLPDEATSFTYPDSFTAMGLAPEYGLPYEPRPYHEQVFRISRLEEIVGEFGLPPDSDDGYEHRPFEFYVEVQVWSDPPVARWLHDEDC